MFQKQSDYTKKDISIATGKFKYVLIRTEYTCPHNVFISTKYTDVHKINIHKKEKVKFSQMYTN